MQTEFVPQQVLFTMTQASTNMNSDYPRKPRIASAVNTTSTNVGFSGQNLIRDPSQGLTSTLLINSQNDPLNPDYNICSGSNISEYERVIKSAA